MKSIIESCQNPSPRVVYQAACAYRDAGLSFLPIASDTSKRPESILLPKVWCEYSQKYRRTWKPFCERQPTLKELQDWLKKSLKGLHYGLAIIGGQVSGNLEILDLDNYEIAKAFYRELEIRSPGLFKKLVKVKTPRPGLHCYWRCRVVEGNQKLASILDPASEKPKPKTVIETRGEGGYCIAPPSSKYCHPRQECYRYFGTKDLTQIPLISPNERKVILETARSFNVWQDRVLESRRPERSRKSKKPQKPRPGDDFNVRADWGEILPPHGWTLVGGDDGDIEYWCRPDKSEGISATTNFEGSGLLYIFTSNAAPFEQDESYTKFAAYALLHCDGDFSEAASELYDRGYGARSHRSKSPKEKLSLLGFKRRSRTPTENDPYAGLKRRFGSSQAESNCEESGTLSRRSRRKK